jgi:hypothetical protein
MDVLRGEKVNQQPLFTFAHTGHYVAAIYDTKIIRQERSSCVEIFVTRTWPLRRSIDARLHYVSTVVKVV